MPTKVPRIKFIDVPSLDELIVILMLFPTNRLHKLEMPSAREKPDEPLLTDLDRLHSIRRLKHKSNRPKRRTRTTQRPNRPFERLPNEFKECFVSWSHGAVSG